MQKTRVGIIGTGGISHMHMAGYKALEGVEVVAACDIDDKRVQTYAERYGIPHVYRDYREMVQRKDLDAVSICTWNNVHADAAITALKAGKHVLCEKPMAMDAVQAAAMKEAAAEAGRLLMIGFVRRYAQETATLKEFIDRGHLGRIYHAKASYLRRCGSPGGWFADRKRSGGGPLIDLGVHVMDLVRYLCGCPMPVSVYGAAFSELGSRSHVKGSGGYRSVDYTPYSDVEDFATAMVRFDNGLVLSVETSFSLNIKEDRGDVELFGTRGGAHLEPRMEIFTEIEDYMVDIAPVLAKPEHVFDAMFQSELAHFVDCVANGTECRSPAEDGVQLMRIIDAIYESAKTGREVVLA